ncbi:hypothetical protein BJ742DRAFT_442871 [Cladochytrium replicatum]|nr:hypothetical protein BJ742DRAFT_442871 [Cladochytrium replicatum]
MSCPSSALCLTLPNGDPVAFIGRATTSLDQRVDLFPDANATCIVIAPSCENQLISGMNVPPELAAYSRFSGCFYSNPSGSASRDWYCFNPFDPASVVVPCVANGVLPVPTQCLPKSSSASTTSSAVAGGAGSAVTTSSSPSRILPSSSSNPSARNSNPVVPAFPTVATASGTIDQHSDSSGPSSTVIGVTAGAAGLLVVAAICALVYYNNAKKRSTFPYSLTPHRALSTKEPTAPLYPPRSAPAADPITIVETTSAPPKLLPILPPKFHILATDALAPTSTLIRAGRSEQSILDSFVALLDSLHVLATRVVADSPKPARDAFMTFAFGEGWKPDDFVGQETVAATSALTHIFLSAFHNHIWASDLASRDRLHESAVFLYSIHALPPTLSTSTANTITISDRAIYEATADHLTSVPPPISVTDLGSHVPLFNSHIPRTSSPASEHTGTTPQPTPPTDSPILGSALRATTPTTTRSTDSPLTDPFAPTTPTNTIAAHVRTHLEATLSAIAGAMPFESSKDAPAYMLSSLRMHALAAATHYFRLKGVDPSYTLVFPLNGASVDQTRFDAVGTAEGSDVRFTVVPAVVKGWGAAVVKSRGRVWAYNA